MVATRRTLPGTAWRWTLGAALVVGIAWVAWRHPTIPTETWGEAQAYRPEQELCAAARDGRQWTSFRVPAAAEAPEGVTVAEAARRFQLEPTPICRANGFDDLAACASQRLEPGRVIVLPLAADPATVAAASAAREALAAPGGES